MLTAAHPEQNGHILPHTPSILPLPLTSPATGAGSVPDMEVIRSLAGRHILNVGMFTKVQLHAIFNLAQAFRMAVYKDRTLDNVLRVIDI